ncbi:hypothetical protein [Streptomyces longispororuber]|nr:hypothetical protein [Streptomyces longispororuber]
MEHGLTLHTGLEPLAAWGQEGIQRIGAEKVPVDAA